MSMTIRCDLASLDTLLDELQGDVEAAARPAAQAGAQVLYDEVLRRVRSIGKVTGNLDNSIYQAYSKDNSKHGVAVYHISWNARKAPHGGLVEFGHIQRYVSYVGSDGHWYTAIRPGMKGKPKPRGKASRAEKDAYYLPLPAPKQVAAQSFIRSAAVVFPRATDAVAVELIKRLAGDN